MVAEFLCDLVAAYLRPICFVFGLARDYVLNDNGPA